MRILNLFLVMLILSGLVSLGHILESSGTFFLLELALRAAAIILAFYMLRHLYHEGARRR